MHFTGLPKFPELNITVAARTAAGLGPASPPTEANFRVEGWFTGKLAIFHSLFDPPPPPPSSPPLPLNPLSSPYPSSFSPHLHPLPLHPLFIFPLFSHCYTVPGAPVSLKATVVDKTSATLSWAAPTEPNGRVLEYQVNYYGYKEQVLTVIIPD